MLHRPSPVRDTVRDAVRDNSLILSLSEGSEGKILFLLCHLMLDELRGLPAFNRKRLRKSSRASVSSTELS